LRDAIEPSVILDRGLRLDHLLSTLVVEKTMQATPGSIIDVRITWTRTGFLGKLDMQ